MFKLHSDVESQESIPKRDNLYQMFQFAWGSSKCHGLNNRNLFFSQSWKLEGPDQDVSLIASFWSDNVSLTSSLANGLLALWYSLDRRSLPLSHGILPVYLCVQIFFFYKDTSYIGLGPISINSF